MVVEQDVSPDDTLIGQIFGSQKPKATIVIIQTLKKCVFRADFDGLYQDCSSVFVRLELSGDEDYVPVSLGGVAALQDIARECIPDLVPETLQIGEKQDQLVSDAIGRKFCFNVLAGVDGVTLEDVWDNMSLANQRAVVTDVVSAIKLLQTVRLESPPVQSILSRYGCASPEATMGGPAQGYLADGRALLAALGKKWSLSTKTVATIEPQDKAGADSAAFLVRSAVDGIAAVAVSEAVLQQWPTEAVLCHNDLSPRYLILKKDATRDAWYSFAGIIDWELAGFYPPAFDLGLQDSYLGASNHQVSFYLLMREELAAQEVIQRTPSQRTLLEVMSLLCMSQHRTLHKGRNISAHIKQRCLDRLHLSLHPDPFRGWVAYPTITKAEMDELEDEVIADIMG